MKTNYILLSALISLVCLSAANCQAAENKWETIDLKNEFIEVQAVPEIGGRIIQYKLADYGFFWINQNLAGKPIPKSRLDPNGGWRSGRDRRTPS